MHNTGMSRGRSRWRIKVMRLRKLWKCTVVIQSIFFSIFSFLSISPSPFPFFVGLPETLEKFENFAENFSSPEKKISSILFPVGS
jgi:hypothetical protein